MFPRTKKSEQIHKKYKREQEMSLISQEIRGFLNNINSLSRPYILEFGSGDGFQVRYLQRIGKVIASDIYTSRKVASMKGIAFVESNITNSAFVDETFDLIFSNHVLEHIADLPRAFTELKRIGKPDCVYVFSVPTNVWLLLSIPAQYYNKVKRGIRSMLSFFRKSENTSYLMKHHKEQKSTILQGIYRALFPVGHGGHKGFIDCYRFFRIKTWRRIFLESGFSALKIHPLLLYGPSEWPIIPTVRPLKLFNLCSSILFIMKKTSN